jgi:hypothetical protein
MGVSSDRGREGVPVEDVALPPPAPVPGPGVYGLDAGGFIQELEGLLTGNVAGYSIRLNENGSPIGLASQNWAAAYFAHITYVAPPVYPGQLILPSAG